MSDREMMEETKKEDPVSVENAAQEDQITEVPADETVLFDALYVFFIKESVSAFTALWF